MLQPPPEHREYITDTPAPSAEEEWRPVVGFDGYEVSNFGRFRNAKTGKHLTVSHATGSRPVIMFSGGDRVSKVSAACCVLEAFVSPRPDLPGKLTAGFRDNDTRNLRPDNLFWMTFADLMRERANDPAKPNHEEDFGLLEPSRLPKPEFVGDNVGKRKLTAEDTHQIQRELAVGVSARTLAERYGISVQNVRVWDPRCWK